MIILPAIDIKDGKVVRLKQGRFDEVSEYSDNPVNVAQQWVAKGAQWLHLVDLDGALSGEVKNSNVILRIARSVKIPVQTGGGIRSTEQVDHYLNNGVRRVILGTRAIEDRTFLKSSLSKWKERIAVSLDCSKGMVAQRGWTTTSKVKATDLAKELEKLGLKCLIFTDIATDGMLSGPNFTAIKEMLACTKIPLIASGGIASLDDIKKLAKWEAKGIMGAITGKALYEGKLDLAEAIRACSPKE